MTFGADDLLPPGLYHHLARLVPDFEILGIKELAADSGATAGRRSTQKATGYGCPVRIDLRGPAGQPLSLVWRVASNNPFGHDHRADRAGNQLLAFDDFARIPGHVAAIDVGAITRAGELISVREGGEFYLLTTYARGTIYADDLRAVAERKVAKPEDLARAVALADYLARLHVPMIDAPRYRRAIRDLIGHGEGIYGIVDGYPAEVPSAPPQRLAAIEQAAATWRWRLRGRERRLTRTHGDFHPFNVVFDDGVHFTALDASRGTCGDPADDVIAMALNFVVFALGGAGSWPRGFGPLWHHFWGAYRRQREDLALAESVPPYLAWRALVLSNPIFYPTLTATARDALLGLAERALHAHAFDPAWADELFR